MKSIALYLGIVFMAIGCASSEETQGQGDNLEASQEGQEGQEANANAEQGEGGDFQGQEANDGELVNNAEEEDVAAQNSGQEAQGEQMNNVPLDTDQADQLTNNAENPAAGQSANEIPAAPTDATAAAPVAPPSGSGMVKYAPASVEVFDQPNGKIVGQFQHGDHPLVYDENGWSRTFDGRYVNQNALSVKGVGRPRDAGMWQ